MYVIGAETVTVARNGDRYIKFKRRIM